MKNNKKFTCINDREAKVEGAAVGTKKQVLAWMKKAFPGIRERREDEMILAVEFFYDGEITAYKTTDEKTLYLAEVLV